MAFNWKDVQRGAQVKSRKFLLYGPPKNGKSTLAGSAKNALMIPTEDRVAHINCDKTPVIKHYTQINEIFASLMNETHPYKRIIFDTIDWLEPHIWDSVCNAINPSTGQPRGWTSINDDYNKETAFSKGLKYHAVAGWKSFLHNCDTLRDKGMDIILVSHSHVIKVNPPDNAEYDKYVMKVDKNALAIIEEWADIIGFYDKEIFVSKSGNNSKTTGKASTTDIRKLHVSGNSASFISGNSFGLVDIPIDLNVCSEQMEYILTGPFVEKTTIKKDGK